MLGVEVDGRSFLLHAGNEYSLKKVSDEEYVAASTAAWARFHSCACQYRTAGLQPMGLVASPTSSSLILIRRELVSWLRPVEALEQVVISGGQGFTPDVFRDISPISDDPGLAQDVLHLLVAAGKVGKLLPPSTMADWLRAGYWKTKPTSPIFRIRTGQCR